ncbi:MAG: IS1182 family transposase [Planctomycetota bacterium]|nr:IS1182 family transposase [Planctomycetota bacterium]
MSKTYREYEPDQMLLLPPNMREWLPENHLALFIGDVVDELDLSSILEVYEEGDGRGYPPFHPRLMVKLLVYAYCKGKPSSRKIEQATHEEVPYRVLAAGQHPDHDTIAAFRKRHLSALAGLFMQVLRLCQEAGLVKLGHVALDGTKIKANASKHKAMSYGRMCEKEQELEREVAALLKEAEAADAAEDAKYGKGKRGDELPAELARRESRLKKIREAKAALEAQAREQAAAKAEEVTRRLAERKQEEETGRKPPGKPPAMPDVEQAKPEAKAQRNFTDPESRIMKDGASHGFEQSYNAQAVVDDAAQIIVAADVTQQANDKRQLVPMFGQVKENVGRMPTRGSADAGYFGEEQLTDESLQGVRLYVPPDRQAHGQDGSGKGVAKTPQTALAKRMRTKLSSVAGRAIYKMRKAIVEPVFGQIKERRGFRRFSFRGLANVSAEWKLIALTHNLLKLFQAEMA